MVSVGDAAPDFTASLIDIDGDIESFALFESLNDVPIVLASFPAAFTETCTTEMCTFRDRVTNFEDVDMTTYGISIDTPFTLTEFTEQNGLNFDFVNNMSHELVDAYGVVMGFTNLGVNRVVKRAVFVVDGSGEVAYVWVSDNPGVEPNYKAVRAAAGKLEVPSEAA